MGFRLPPLNCRLILQSLVLGMVRYPVARVTHSEYFHPFLWLPPNGRPCVGGSNEGV